LGRGSGLPRRPRISASLSPPSTCRVRVRAKARVRVRAGGADGSEGIPGMEAVVRVRARKGEREGPG